jgi:hypothetical protein
MRQLGSRAGQTVRSARCRSARRAGRGRRRRRRSAAGRPAREPGVRSPTLPRRPDPLGRNLQASCAAEASLSRAMRVSHATVVEHSAGMEQVFERALERGHRNGGVARSRRGAASAPIDTARSDETHERCRGAPMPLLPAAPEFVGDARPRCSISQIGRLPALRGSIVTRGPLSAAAARFSRAGPRRARPASR